MTLRSNFDKTGTIYRTTRDNLIKQMQSNQAAVLNIHIPGTGCRFNARLPTYIALGTLTSVNPANSSPAVLYFEGTGATGEAASGYVAPSMNARNTLDKQPKQPSFLNMFAGSVTSDMDDIVQSESSAHLLGIIGGAGKKTNNARVIGALTALEQDNALPTIIFLSGHSRGAINCISLANEIYANYQDRIAVHLLLTDPVPGPGYSTALDTLIVPQNVVSFTCFYAANEDRSFLTAHDLTRLCFKNPRTTITTYPIAGNHNTFFSNLNDCQHYFDRIVHAINFPGNDLSFPHALFRQTLDPEIKGIGSREGSVYSQLTPINDTCPAALSRALAALRQFMGGDGFDSQLRDRWRECKTQFINAIVMKVANQLDFKFNYAQYNYRMISDQLKTTIRAELREILRNITEVLTDVELAILLTDANTSAIGAEIAGELAREKTYDVRNGTGMKLSGLTEIYYASLNKNKLGLSLQSLSSSLGFNTTNNQHVTAVADNLYDWFEYRKKQIYLQVFVTLAKYADSTQITELVQACKENESIRMRLLRLERRSVGENKLPVYGDTTSYTTYCATIAEIHALRMRDSKAAVHSTACTSTQARM